MLYKLVKITDLNGKDKEDADAKGRIGRVFNFNKGGLKNIAKEKRLYMECYEPGFYKSVITSLVKDVIIADDGFIVKTENSMYFLIEKEIAEQHEKGGI